MVTIKRTIVILILLAIAFFIYRGISPSGADQLLVNIKNIPVRLWLFSGELIPVPAISSGTIVVSWAIATGSDVSTGEVMTGEALVFSSTLSSGGLFALESLVIPVEKTTTIAKPTTTWWSLIIVQTPAEIKTPVVNKAPVVIKKPTVAPVVVTKKPSSRITNQDYALLNNLFK